MSFQTTYINTHTQNLVTYCGDRILMLKTSRIKELLVDLQNYWHQSDKLCQSEADLWPFGFKMTTHTHTHICIYMILLETNIVRIFYFGNKWVLWGLLCTLICNLENIKPLTGGAKNQVITAFCSLLPILAGEVGREWRAACCQVWRIRENSRGEIQTLCPSRAPWGLRLNFKSPVSDVSDILKINK